MRQVQVADEMLETPVGRYIAGQSFVVWGLSPTLLGAFHFGALDSRDNSTLAQLFPLPSHPSLAPRIDLMHDLGSVEVFDRVAFEFFEQFLRLWIDVLKTRVQRVAVVRPGGVAGAAFAGMYHEWVAPNFDARLCLDRHGAYQWLAIGEDGQQELEDVYGKYLQPPLVRDVQRAIAANLRTATVTRVAADLALSPRTLQRLLTGLGTSFRNEVERTRLRHAEAMLLDGAEKIEAIAREVGFASATTFIAMFQRLRGEPPGVFRARVRRDQ